jgi:hypothetical protein
VRVGLRRANYLVGARPPVCNAGLLFERDLRDVKFASLEPTKDGFAVHLHSKLRSCVLVQLRVRDVRHGQSWRAERLSFNKRRSGLCSLRSQNRPE